MTLNKQARIALVLLWLALGLALLPAVGWETLAQVLYGAVTKLLVKEALLLLVAL